MPKRDLIQRELPRILDEFEELTLTVDVPVDLDRFVPDDQGKPAHDNRGIALTVDFQTTIVQWTTDDDVVAAKLYFHWNKDELWFLEIAFDAAWIQSGIYTLVLEQLICQWARDKEIAWAYIESPVEAEANRLIHQASGFDIIDDRRLGARIDTPSKVDEYVTWRHGGSKPSWRTQFETDHPEYVSNPSEPI